MTLLDQADLLSGLLRDLRGVLCDGEAAVGADIGVEEARFVQAGAEGDLRRSGGFTQGRDALPELLRLVAAHDDGCQQREGAGKHKPAPRGAEERGRHPGSLASSLRLTTTLFPQCRSVSTRPIRT